ncbi:MAG: type II toxin-antitoxin system HicB family antitoxin [Bryobacterales bacterium]|nr:type II toxin-antitoxin system HicB family antitoxin [Bryobacterales bacterium]
MTDHTYTVLFHEMPEGGFAVSVPAIPEICTYGRTLSEARRMAQDAIQCVLKSAAKAGEELPADVIAATSERLAISLP